MAKNNAAKKSFYQKWWFWVIIGVLAIGVIGAAMGGKKQTSETKETSQTKEENKSEDKFTDALRKCSVMEGIDIYTTGIGGKGGNYFDDAKETCESHIETIYNGDRDKFITNTNIAWDEVKDEEVDGHTYSYYLEILGW